MNNSRSFIALLVVSGAVHSVWEYLHMGLYVGYGALEGALPVWVYATLGDVAYTLVAGLLIALFKGRMDWVGDARGRDYPGLAILGFTIALLVEYKALALHRWAYAAAMPIIPYLHVGLSPILQMTLLLPLSVWIAARVTR